MAPKKPNNSDWVVPLAIAALLFGAGCFIWQVALPFISFVYSLFEETEAAPQPPARPLVGCKKGAEVIGFVCDQGSPIAITSIEDNPGLHFIGTLSDEDGTVIGAHVADTCQHYFCSMNSSCMAQKRDAASCFNTTGCCLAHQVTPMTSGSAHPPRP